MASNPEGQQGSENFSDSGNAPSFFKVIFSPTHFGIKIPTKFMNKYGDSLEKVVILKVPTGDSWRVELSSYDYGTWIMRGWQRFAVYYSIKKGHFLVFRYDGNSQFHVLIFDPTASEIKYPVDDTSIRRQKPVENHHPTARLSKGKRPKTDETESIEILDDFAADCNNMKKMRGSSSEETGNSYPKSVNVRRSTRLTKQESFAPLSSLLLRQSMRDEENFMSYQRAKAFKSENPFFICFTYPTYLAPRFDFVIPSQFRRLYITKEKQSGEVVLSVAKGKRWSVVWRFNGRFARIVNSGWKEFALGNNLKLGDVCIFELVTTKELNVIIHRAA